MSSIVRVGRVSTSMMEPNMMSEVDIWREVGIEANTYGCTGCGLVWDRKWYAEQCEDRNHAHTWEQRYGGRIENERHVGYKAYSRTALAYRKDIVK